MVGDGGAGGSGGAVVDGVRWLPLVLPVLFAGGWSWGGGRQAGLHPQLPMSQCIKPTCTQLRLLHYDLFVDLCIWTSALRFLY